MSVNKANPAALNTANELFDLRFLRDYFNTFNSIRFLKGNLYILLQSKSQMCCRPIVKSTIVFAKRTHKAVSVADARSDLYRPNPFVPFGCRLTSPRKVPDQTLFHVLWFHYARCAVGSMLSSHNLARPMPTCIAALLVFFCVFQYDGQTLPT